MTLSRDNLITRLAFGSGFNFISLKGFNPPDKTTLGYLVLKSILGIIRWPASILALSIIFILGLLFLTALIFFGQNLFVDKKNLDINIIPLYIKGKRIIPYAWITPPLALYGLVNLYFFYQNPQTLLESKVSLLGLFEVISMLTVVIVIIPCLIKAKKFLLDKEVEIVN